MPEILLQDFLGVIDLKYPANSRCSSSVSLERDSEVENSTQKVYYVALSELTAAGEWKNKTEQGEKVGYQAVSTETLAGCTRSSEAEWSRNILSIEVREWSLQSPVTIVIGWRLPMRRGCDLGRDNSLQQQLCSVIDNYWSWRRILAGVVNFQYLQQQEWKLRSQQVR